MKHFSFNLQKVLELRKYREQEAKVELGRAIGILTEIENRIKETAARRYHALAGRFSDTDTAMQVWEHYILRLDQEALRLANEAAQAELVVEEKRTAYLGASRELTVMEKLKEKREKEYRKEMFAVETAELDDLWRPG